MSVFTNGERLKSRLCDTKNNSMKITASLIKILIQKELSTAPDTVQTRIYLADSTNLTKKETRIINMTGLLMKV